jgi:hypothetical protein
MARSHCFAALCTPQTSFLNFPPALSVHNKIASLAASALHIFLMEIRMGIFLSNLLFLELDFLDLSLRSCLNEPLPAWSV